MLRRAVAFLVFAAAAFGATMRLYLKDGTYQLAREYQVLQDRVRFYSTERSEWEEIPLDLIDLDRTKKEAAQRAEAIQAEAKAQSEEDAAENAEIKEIERIPAQPGVYYIHGEKLDALKVGESTLVNDKKRSVLKVLSPLPILGRSTLELDGEKSAARIAETRPEFYFRLSADESFRMVKLTPKVTQQKKHSRVVETVEKIPVSDEVIEGQKEVETFKKEEGDLLFKIWPVNALDPGEYALVQFTDGKVNVQVWDFGVDAAKVSH